MSGFFGGDKKEETESKSTTEIELSPAIGIEASTGGGGSLTVDNTPTGVVASARISSDVRSTIAEGLSNSNDALGRIEETIADLRSNTNAFINARVTPLAQAVESRIAQKSREFSQRKIFGGLASAEIDQFRLEGEAEIAEQTALATQEALNATLAAEGVAGQVNDDIAAAAQQLLTVELAELGLSLDAIRLSQATIQPTSQTTSGTSLTTTDDGGGVLGDIAAIASAFNTQAPAPAPA